MKKTRVLFLVGTIIVSTLFVSSTARKEPPAARENRHPNPPIAAAGRERTPKILRMMAGDYTVSVSSNGAITAGHVLHFLGAHYVLGENERADNVLRAMLERQKRGEFANGVRDAGRQGIDWTTWDGRPSGYEGYLADSFRFLQSVLLREPEFRARLYRPLLVR